MVLYATDEMNDAGMVEEEIVAQQRPLQQSSASQCKYTGAMATFFL